MLFGSGSTSLQKNTSQDEIKKLTQLSFADEEFKDTGSANVKDNIELCLKQCEGSYRRGIEIIHGLYRKGINPKDHT